jgi:phosphate starvation-inducible PhoH-like protein
VEGVSFNYFGEEDVVRHHLVQRIIRAYDQKSKSQQLSLLREQEESQEPLQQ